LRRAEYPATQLPRDETRMAELALEQTLNFGDYLEAFRRRRNMILSVAGIVFLLGLIAAFLWPPTYASSATILIEEQEIPAELVQSTVTSYASERIQVISQRVMTRSNLQKIIDQYGLYTDKRKYETTEEVLEDMRDDIKLDMINADVMDPRTGRPTAATIAFTVGFEGKDPETVQQVANELTTLYLNENLRTRTEKAKETTAFLTEESKRLSAEISRLEAALAEFKEKNVDRLPDQRDLNTQVLQRTESEISDTNTQIRSLEDRKTYLEGQLAIIDPYGSGTVQSPAARLAQLRTEYITYASRYSPSHPDVISRKREIEALEKETGITETDTEKRARLDALRKELVVTQKTYTDEHPDVKSLKRQIAALEDELRHPVASSAPKPAPATPDNPAYITLQSQLEATNSDIKSYKAQLAKLNDKVDEYEQRLQQTPQVEREYRELLRDLDNSTKQYQEIKDKQMSAEIAQSMEKERKGERFTLIDPPILPEKPVSPNRPAIIFLSLVLALGAGAGSAAMAESMDTAVRGAKGIIAILNTAPLAVIPYLASSADIGREKKRQRLIIAAVIAAIVVILLLINFLYSPLDVLWFRGLRKMDAIVGG
jgi:succinoglycan biosynthesis transport protein ExoP